MVGFNVRSCVGRVVGFNVGRRIGQVIGLNVGRCDGVKDPEVGINIMGIDVNLEVGVDVALLEYVPLQLGQYTNSACPHK